MCGFAGFSGVLENLEYKEKIINYEKGKKQQTGHAELLKVLAVKLNSYVDALSKSKNY